MLDQLRGLQAAYHEVGHLDTPHKQGEAQGRGRAGAGGLGADSLCKMRGRGRPEEEGGGQKGWWTSYNGVPHMVACQSTNVHSPDDAPSVSFDSADAAGAKMLSQFRSPWTITSGT